jgi:predicted NUDIX family NTP pyrophosphohydrolase
MKKSAGILIYRKKNGKIQVFLVHPGGLFWKNKDLNSWSIPKGEVENEEDLKNTAIREFEEETGIVLTDEDKEKIFYLGEVKSKNKIVYVFALEKDLGDNIEIKSNLVRRRLSRLNADYAEKYQESKLIQTKSENKFIEFPEVDKGEYFDLDVAREKLVSYQKELIDMIKFM